MLHLTISSAVSPNIYMMFSMILFLLSLSVEGKIPKKKGMAAVMFEPALPERGPMPWEVPAIVKNNVTVSEIPVLESNCDGITTLNVSHFSIYRSYYRPGKAILGYKVSGCSEVLSLRTRLLTFEFVKQMSGVYMPRTTDISSSTFRNGPGDFVVTPDCKKQMVYIEACVRLTSRSAPLCGTSVIKELFASNLVATVLFQQPPLTLRLGAGDRPRMVYRLRSAPAGRRYRLQVVVMKNETLISASKWLSGTNVSEKLPLSGNKSAGVVPWKYDGAEVFLRFAYESCPSNIVIARQSELYNTTLIVRQSIPRLSKQDTKLPTVEKLIFPPTVHEQPASLTIRAKNPGNGRRADGSQTKLSYQWYVQYTHTNFFPSYPFAPKGLTSPTVHIAKAECDDPDQCGKHGCFSIRRYHVVVCNTLGCVSSNIVSPNILPPKLKDGERWDAYDCRVVKEKVS